MLLTILKPAAPIRTERIVAIGCRVTAITVFCSHE